MILLKDTPVTVIKSEAPGTLLVTVEMPNGEHRNYWPGLLKGTVKGLDEIVEAQRLADTPA